MENNRNFTSTINVDATPRIAFDAIRDFRAWWSEEIEGDTGELNETFFYHYRDIHLCKLQLVEAIPEKRLVYRVLANRFNFIKDQKEWVNTSLIFDIRQEGDKTKVTFTHEGLVPDYECYEVCHEAWTNYIQNSLRKLITLGKGEPNPKDKDGFNAEIVKKWRLDENSKTTAFS
jgi:hypothetical protein